MEGIDRLSHESFRRDREPPVERRAAGLGDRIWTAPSVSSRLILCGCDEAGRHQTLQLSIDVADAQSDARALLVGLHQGVPVDGLTVRHQGEENVAQHRDQPCFSDGGLCWQSRDGWSRKICLQR